MNTIIHTPVFYSYFFSKKLHLVSVQQVFTQPLNNWPYYDNRV